MTSSAEGRVRVCVPRIGRREYFTILLLAIEVVLFSLLSEHFLSWRNVNTVLRNATDLALVSIGMTLVMVLCGIDISVGSALGVVAILVGWMVGAKWNPWLTALVAVLAGALLGSVNGFLIAVLDIPDIIATIGTSSVLRAAVFMMLGGQWLTGIDPVFSVLTRGRLFGLPLSLFIVGAFFAAFWYLMTHRSFGRHVYAIGNSAQAAALAGIDGRRVRIASYALVGALVGVASLFYVGRLGSVEITVGNDLALSAIAATVIGGTSVTGGRGSVIGTLAGVLFMAFMKNGIVLLGIPSLWERAVVGLLIVLSVSIDLALERRQERKKREERTARRRLPIRGALVERAEGRG